MKCSEKDGKIFISNGTKQGRIHQKYGVRFNIWSYGTGYGKSAKNPIAFEHPAIFPLQLAKDHILSWSNPNDVVLDCFMGSGSTGIAAIQNNCNFIGIEKDDTYFELASKRMQDRVDELNGVGTLFEGLIKGGLYERKIICV